MGFINAVLDEEVDYGFEGGPEYATESVDLENGLQYRDSAWKFPRHRYSASFENIGDDEREAIIKVFHAVRGKRHSFKFKDWNDYTATAEPLSVESGTSNPVQLYKTYAFGEAFTIRPVQALAFATIYLNVGGTPTPVPGTLDLLLGTFTPNSAWGAGEYSWSGEFYVWVHFTADYNAFTINSWRANTASVELEEDKRKIVPTNMPVSWEE